MPRGLKRHQEARDLHFITFSCYHREPLLASSRAMHQFEVALELSRVLYDFYITGYVVMPEHVHLLISEPQRWPSIPFFRSALGGFGPSHTENSTGPKAGPAMVSLSLPLRAKVVPVPGT